MEIFKILNGLRELIKNCFLRDIIYNTRGNSMKLYKDRVNRHVFKIQFC